ncbi:Cu+-exporting ATPase [Lutibacter agarilyticus]|uniref:Cu+-exporting ATPase n=1 Tax=Lutibacter agarilyticus TaxID=1109740 RepID=A0A238VU84_9FLAO|nr:heavy metal-associated domain-containing protein [Lutibacter agarilyticus]SNR37363.1 Cu+-exporting ATPase [Lutibacter agarilyticus]
MKQLIIAFFSTIAFFSCNEVKKETSTNKQEVTTKEVAADYKSIEVDIEGMTCEIGCARTIQSKLSKVDGVTFAKVDFEAKKGQFTFDTHKVSKNEIIKKIDGIAGGDVYSVTNTKELVEIIN